MVSKLSEQTKIHGKEHALEDEIIIIPENHDSGFNEYMNSKICKVYEKLRTRKRISECHLELTYPKPDSHEYFFSVFKEAPDHHAKDGRFCGLFTIDVSSYITEFNSEAFSNLISYIRDQLTNTTILLVVSTDNPAKASGIIQRTEKLGFIASLLPMPTADRVLDYAKGLVGDEDRVDSRRTELINAIEGAGFEVVEDIAKALATRTRMTFRSNSPDTGKRFGY